jgi:hypothetical protein
MTYTPKQIEDATQALDSTHFVMSSLRDLMVTDNQLLSTYAAECLMDIVPVRDKIQRLKSALEMQSQSDDQD